MNKPQAVTKEQIASWFEELCNTYTPPVLPKPEKKIGIDLLVIPLSDLHYGLQATKERTGNEYDLDIAIMWSSRC